MLNIHLWKFLTHSTTTVVLLTSVNLALPSVSLAQQRTVSQASSISTDYLLGGGDRIRVNIFEVPEYTGEYQVPPGGSINLPLIGSISVLGLTTEQAADEIAKRYARFLKRPLISVNLLSPRPINIFVAGEVTRPGAYTLSLQGSGGDNPGLQYPTILAALSTAQGVTLAADVTKVQLRRKIGRSQEQVIALNLKEITQTGRIPQDITLRDGDTIVVPTATDFNVAEARNLFAANYAASQTAPRTVAITGQVYRPGSYLVTPGGGGNDGGAPGTGLPTVMRAIQLAGGITSQADVRSIKIRRPTRIGSEQTLNLNLWELLQTGDLNQDVVLQDGDTIVVPTASAINPAEATQLATTTLSPATIQVGVVGEVKKPGLTNLQPNSSLNQALLAAGGFNDARASSGAVDLIRLNPNGTVTKRVVKIDFSKGINEDTNPILRNNDVVVVNRSGVAKAGDTVGTVAGPLGLIFNVLRFFGF
ncbi:polysaccharide biosynthesis/export family protein [Sphaerospermopsis sp. LEGE 08334]|jgi:polysaccharide export outer membrane protein|uniref:polysaccharide biosynthesis/export family protein n=1 Tax=Sphaerospermopsis sp. LEGE 08334 TaxID=1828651 RepID=UPI001880A331|nr:polysaccharide biosynthesis/export family protein [Sphaerospermopsis sp. LEGE 08334]MBE9059116.1 SLBB domain-containing protein [Sphaerospermopsis sp. LEGE 08334]